MSAGPDGWLTVQQAATRTGASPATVKRYAVTATGSGDAVRVPVVPGGSKLRWLINPAALDRWDGARGSGAKPSPVVAPPPGRPDAPGPAPDGVHDRLGRLERALLALADRVETVLALAVDDVQAARTAALAEKTVSERLRSAQRAQQDAAAARAASQRLQEEATAQARTAADKEAEAAAAVGEALDARSHQLDQLLTPGSAAGIEPERHAGTAPTS